MEFYPGKIYHIYNRGNNHQKIFYERKNYLFFLKKMKIHLNKHCDILAWCLMTNHFHWMIKIHDNYSIDTNIDFDSNLGPNIQPLNRSISTLLSSYAKAINSMYDRTGSLFQRRTKSIDVNSIYDHDENYPLVCFNYIHQNPLKAGIVKNMEDYEFSSFNDYAGLRTGTLCNKSLAIELLELPISNKDFLELSYRLIPDNISKRLF